MVHSKRIILVLLAGLAFCGALAACGKKAAHVDPPQGVDDDRFPFVYPDPATDPTPQGKP